jgi:outer membrane protein assembly factor BamD (BamD/ComL family)
LSSLISNQRLARTGERTASSLDLEGKTPAGPATTSVKSLMDNLPLTPEKMKKSEDSVEKAMFSLGKSLQEGLPDYGSAIGTYDSLLRRIPATPLREEILFNLFYCYTKLGDQANADRILQIMKSGYPAGKFTATAINPDSAVQAAGKFRSNATQQYEKIYSSFIEGRFDEALAEKKVADSLYGSTYWTPQLLYIEAVYFIHNRQDAQAKTVLTNIQSKFPNDPMAVKAGRLVDVLNRRRQIENYLTNLKIVRASDSVDLAVQPVDSFALRHPQPGARTVVAPPRFLLPRDSTQKNKPDSGKLAGKPTGKPVDSSQASLAKKQSDSAHAITSHIKALNSAFVFTPEKTQAVVLLMTKVDPVYVTEAKNAFNRYNLENYYSQAFTINNVSLNDSVKLMIVDSFENSAAALDYLSKARAMAPRQIVPWLPKNNYSFLLISGANLELLLKNKDMDAYRKFLMAAYPGKF